ncbi:MAG: InlB B-repeat-containing protein, partial [Treponema sp.]|nr:InlB B-repeat-containing protein [Treponema sp.]
MKSFIKPAVLFTALAMVFVLASCEAETKTDNPVMYTVIFDGNGSEPAFTDKVSVKSGEGLLIPKIKLIKTGYDFAGWYIGDVEVDADTKITKDTTVTAHWTLHEYSITYAGLEDAENPNTVTTYTIESEEIPLLDATKNGCTFGGWKNGDEFVTEIAKGTTGDITLTALWEIIPVTDVILNNTELTLITGDTETLTATVLPENPFDKTVTWTSSNKNVATVTNGVVTAVAKGNATITASVEEQSAMCTVTVENSITMLPAGTDGTAGTDGVYLLFGRWPQTVKTADVTIKNETKRAGMFTYYKGSDGEWYVKVVENPISSAYTYSDGTAVGWGGTSEKYFKVEPIKWRILTDNYSGKKLLLAENILVNCAYYDNTSTRTINGNNVYVNNYEHSRVRAY